MSLKSSKNQLKGDINQLETAVLAGVINADAGHSSPEPGITRELVAATNRIVKTDSPVKP